MRKLWAIIWKENYLRFTDRTGAIYMFATPILLSAIIGLAFSGLMGAKANDVPALNIPVGIVNLDEGSAQGNFGAIFVTALVPADSENPDPTNPLFTLFNARTFASPDEAMPLVQEGALAALLVIPADFTASLSSTPAAYMAAAASGETPPVGHTGLVIHWNRQAQISAPIFRDTVQAIANGISTSTIAVNSTVSAIVRAIPSNPALGLQLASGGLNDTIAGIARAAAQPGANPILIQQVDVAGEQVGFDPLAYFSPGFAIFFMGFTVTVGSASILQEHRRWTLQRMVTTPTTNATILGGKMLGTYIGGLLQMIVLILAMILVGRILEGPEANIWGNDPVAIAILTLCAVAAATGVGIAIASFAKTEEQAGNLAAFILFTMGLVGGVFFPTLTMPEFLQFLPRLTFHFWGMNGYTELAAGGNVMSILDNAAALLVIAGIFFTIGLVQFNRRLDL